MSSQGTRHLEWAIKTALWYWDASALNEWGGIASASCMSLVGGKECVEPLMRGLEALKSTGINPADPKEDDLEGRFIGAIELPTHYSLERAIAGALWYLGAFSSEPGEAQMIEPCFEGGNDCETALSKAVSVLLATGLRAWEADEPPPRPRVYA